MSGPPRRQLHGYLSTEARDGWYHFAEKHDTNVTALLEAVGMKLASLAEEGGRLPVAIAEITREAQRTAGRRSTRRRAATE